MATLLKQQSVPYQTALLRSYKNMDSREQAILKTLLYSDLFNYPLTKDELYAFLPQAITRTNFLQVLKNSRLPIEFSQNLIFPKRQQENS